MKPTRARLTSANTTSRKILDWCARHPIIVVAVYVCVVSLIFLIFPGIDLKASALFYFGPDGFAAQDVPFLREVRHLGPFLVRVIAVACVGILLLKLLVPGRPPLMPLRQPVFLLSTLILGPGVLVNAVLKDNWGRPRPRSVEEFGGDLPFQPVWKMTDHCDSNCSFVSGEGSAAMWLVATALLLPATWRKAALAFLIPLGLVLSVNRVAFGGHFLSDTLLSWGLTLLLVLAIHHLLFVKDPPLTTDRQLDEWFTKRGRGAQRLVRRLLARIRQSLRAVARIFSTS
ncbi:phosphatase PAP2 family protein [Roseibium sp. AS2]|uniref:phosphatase PAP2 family protein n=1 Tax=Roseibium sp. AS2 TaxID=3135781 RepID=UPI0031817E0C